MQEWLRNQGKLSCVWAGLGELCAGWEAGGGVLVEWAASMDEMRGSLTGRSMGGETFRMQ